LPSSKGISVPSLDLVIWFPSLNKRILHVLNATKLFVRDVFNINPFKFELLIEFLTLPPKLKLLLNEP